MKNRKFHIERTGGTFNRKFVEIEANSILHTYT